MKTEKLLLELEVLMEKTGYTIRKERGTFRGDECVVEGEKLVVINRNKPAESQVATIAKVLKTIDLNDVFIKPAVRKELAAVWEKMLLPQGEKFPDAEEG